MTRRRRSRSAFLSSRVLVSLTICAIAVFIALVAHALYPGGNAQASSQVQQVQAPQALTPEPAIPDHGQTLYGPITNQIPDGVLENAVRGDGRVVSITVTPLSAYDHAVLTGQNPIPLSPVVPSQPIAPDQSTPTPSPSGAQVLLDTFTGKTAYSFVNSTFRAYMGDGFTNNTLPGNATYISIRSFTCYMTAAVTANYSDVHGRLGLWNTYNSASSPVFSNGAALFDVDFGPLNVTLAPVFYTFNVEVQTPHPFLSGGSGAQWGYVQNFQANTGAGLQDTQNLTSLVPNGGTYAAGTITTGTSPNFGWYMSNSTWYNFNPYEQFTFAGRTNQAVGIIIRGDPNTGSPGATPTPFAPTPTPTATPTEPPFMTPVPPTCQLPYPIGSEDFGDITTLIPAAYNMQNLSLPGPGTTGWFQGSTALFNSQAGAGNAYIAANYNNGTGTSTLSNWLITPPLTLQNGGVLSFWTRTVDTVSFPDRLQVRMSTNGSSISVGTSATSVGDFTTLMLDINPTYTTSGYPVVWSQFCVTISGLGAPTTGRLAFRYFVENGGPAGSNSDYIGIDTVTYRCNGGVDCGTPTPSPSPSPTPTPSATPTPTPTPWPNGCAFSSGAAVPIPIMDNAVAVVGGNLYSFAGFSNSNVIANSYKFDGVTWSAIASMPVTLDYPAAVSNGTDVYIVGGIDGQTGSSVNTLYRYNVGTDTYTTLAPCNVASSNHALVYLNGKIYKIAGTDYIGVSVSNLEIYDIASNTWSTGTAYPIAESFPMAFAVGNFIYVAGGIDATTGAESAKTYRYDPSTNTWDDAAIADLPTPRWGGASGWGTCCTNGPVLAGGISSGNAIPGVIWWNPGTNLWSSLPDMITPRCRMNGGVLDSGFYLIGGSTFNGGFTGTIDTQKLSSLSCVSENFIYGNVSNCASPAPTATPPATPTPPSLPGVPDVLMTLSGSSTATTLTSASGSYFLPIFGGGGVYTVTPSKGPLAPASGPINTTDVLAVQRHFLGITLIPTGCRLSAADANTNGSINTQDVLAVQRFFLGFTSGTGSCGQYKFRPASTTYISPGMSRATDYFMYVAGDVVSPFANRPSDE